MAESNDIDKLFQEKLAGSGVGGYSEAAWNGAAALLDKHYKMLFWKKALMIVAPILLIAGITWFALPGEGTTASVISDQHQVSSVESESDAQVSQDNGAFEEINLNAKNEETRSQNGVAEVTSSSTDDNKELKPEYAAATATTADPISGIGSTSSGSASFTSPDEAQPSSNNSSAGLSAPGLTKTNARGLSTSSSGARSNTFTAPSLLNTTNDLDQMPVFEVGNLGAGDASSIALRDRLKKQRPELNAPRFELRAGAGGLVASTLHDDALTNTGYFGEVMLTYHFEGRLFVSTGAIYARRSASYDRFAVWAGDQRQVLTSVSYIDVPIQIGYRLGARHNLSFGMAFSPLAGVGEKQQPPFPLETEVENPLGHRAGFASFDVAGLLDYRYQISSRLFVQAQFRLGLFDITDDEFFLTGDQNEHNHQARFGLSYRLFSR